MASRLSTCFANADLIKALLAHKEAFSVRASRPLSTISLARHIRLMEDNDRLEASRYSTSCSRFGSEKLPCEDDGDGGAGGEVAIVYQYSITNLKQDSSSFSRQRADEASIYSKCHAARQARDRFPVVVIASTDYAYNCPFSGRAAKQGYRMRLNPGFRIVGHISNLTPSITEPMADNIACKVISKCSCSYKSWILRLGYRRLTRSITGIMMC
jgi:hypothetical protein